MEMQASTKIRGNCCSTWIYVSWTKFKLKVNTLHKEKQFKTQQTNLFQLKDSNESVPMTTMSFVRLIILFFFSYTDVSCQELFSFSIEPGKKCARYTTSTFCLLLCLKLQEQRPFSLALRQSLVKLTPQKNFADSNSFTRCADLR